MAPLTRMRAFDAAVATSLMATHYGQRASEGGLLIAEATVVSPTGFPHHNVPGVFSEAQTEGWKATTDAVHAKGGFIYLQLWHGGRASHPKLQPGEQRPLAPSELMGDGGSRLPDGTAVPFEMPRAMDVADIKSTIEDYAKATQNAVDAGFDGVEVHCANGYLPDQFLQDGANHRTDSYGGGVENRARFAIEIVEACAKVIGMDRVGVRISPQNPFNGVSDSDPVATFTYLTRELSKRNLGYLHLIEPRVRGNVDFEVGAPPIMARQLRSEFTGILMAAGGFTRDTANALLAEGGADLIAFGRHFTSNPDLPERFRLNLPLTPYDRDTFYGGDGRGYTDFTEAAS